MLIGCCHCAEEPSEPSEPSEPPSEPPSESQPPSEPPSDGPSTIIEPANCSACLGIPARWRVNGLSRGYFNLINPPMTGSNGDGRYNIVDCPATFLDGAVLELIYLHPGGMPASGTVCALWATTQKVLNHAAYYHRPADVPPSYLNPWSPTCQESIYTSPAGVNSWVERRIAVRMKKVGAGYPGTQINLQLMVTWGVNHTNPQPTTFQIAQNGCYFGAPPYNTGQNFTLTGRNCLRDFVLNGPYDVVTPNVIYQTIAPGTHPVTLSPA